MNEQTEETIVEEKPVKRVDADEVSEADAKAFESNSPFGVGRKIRVRQY